MQNTVIEYLIYFGPWTGTTQYAYTCRKRSNDRIVKRDKNPPEGNSVRILPKDGKSIYQILYQLSTDELPWYPLIESRLKQISYIVYAHQI